MKFSVFLPTGFGGEFGGFTEPTAAADLVLELARTAEETGFHGVWLPDHFQTIPPSSSYVFESWSLLAAMTGRTNRVRIGQLVSGNGYRNPALQAKIASTVDVLSNGRLSFGIVAGWYERDYQAFGYPFLPAPERLRQLREAVEVIQSLWTNELTTYDGQYYQLVDAVNQPRGIQQPIPLMIAGGGEKVTLKLAAQYADLCNVMVSPADAERKFAILRDHAVAVGRDYDEITRTVTTSCLITDTDEEAAAQLSPGMGAFYPGDFAHYLLYGSLDTVRRRIEAYESAGVQELIVGFHAGNPEALRSFAKEFVS
jgi:F420-dependent oxidoreductase-like protein